jgi:hypothetical protein
MKGKQRLKDWFSRWESTDRSRGSVKPEHFCRHFGERAPSQGEFGTAQNIDPEALLPRRENPCEKRVEKVQNKLP